MAAIYARQGQRCPNHPHREPERPCDACGRRFCADCLTPTPRDRDGTRRCAACLTAASHAERGRVDERQRQRSSARRTRLAVAAGALGVFACAALGTAVFILAAPRLAPLLRSLGAGASLHEARCGELTRIRSVTAIGVQGPDDAVNVLAYPQRAPVRLVGATSPPTTPTLAALVDECDTGWHSSEVVLPLTLEIEIDRVGSYLQRVALWQDPSAPRSAWVKDFELLLSETSDGDDFRPATLDRPAQLRDSLEAQWFQFVQRAPSGAGQGFTDPLLVRRLRLRITSTYGPSAPGGTGQVAPPAQNTQVALGEIAAYGSDREVLVLDVEPPARPTGPYAVFGLRPPLINALARTDTFVRFTNTSRVDHHLVTNGLQPDLDVPLPAGETRTGLFWARQAGRVEFYCKLSTHALDGLTGIISVK